MVQTKLKYLTYFLNYKQKLNILYLIVIKNAITLLKIIIRFLFYFIILVFR